MARGDHLYVDRQGGIYTHHGIDIGDGSVVHYLEGDTIVRTPVEQFCRGQPLRLRDYSVADPVEWTLERALSRVGEQSYNVLFNNCEHFASWCKTGKASSRQVEKAALGAAAVGGLALGAPLALPALAIAGGFGVASLLDQARTADPRTAQQLLGDALGSLRHSEGQLRQQVAELQREADSWQQAANLALQRQREDLARAALEKRYPLKQQLSERRRQLEDAQLLLARIEAMLPSG